MFFFQVRDLAIIPVITIRILLIAFDLSIVFLFGLISLVLLERIIGKTEEDDKLRLAFHSSPRGFAIIDADGTINHANQAFLRQFGLSDAVCGNTQFEPLISRHLQTDGAAGFYPRSLGATNILHLRPGEKGDSTLLVSIRRLPQEDAGWIASVDSSPVQGDADGREGLPPTIANLLTEAVVVIDLTDTGMVMVRANTAFADLTGHQLADVVGRSPRDLQIAGGPAFEQLLQAAVSGERPGQSTLRLSHRDGSTFLAEIRVASLPLARPGDGIREGRVVVVIRDISDLQRLEKALFRATDVDPTTSLATLGAFRTMLPQLTHPDGHRQLMLALIMIPRYQELMALYGNSFCAQLLVKVAERLVLVGAAAVGRTGNCEFALAIFLPPTDDATTAAQTHALGIKTILRDTFALPGVDLGVQFCIGYAIGDGRLEEAQLERQARAALWQAMMPGNRNPVRFHRQLTTAIHQRVGLTQDLRHGVKFNEFRLHYDVRADLDTGRIIGAEVSPRWYQPAFGMQSPDCFMPIAEENGMIVAIGQWMLLELGHFAVSVNKARETKLTFGINLTPVQWRDPSLHERLAKIVAETGAKPEWFSLQISKGAFALPQSELRCLLHRLHSAGFALALADLDALGAAMSQLGTLRLDAMFVDASLIRDAEPGQYGGTVIGAAVAIAGNRGACVTARGIVEDHERKELLQLGCHFGQGATFGVDLTESAFRERLSLDSPPLPVAEGVARLSPRSKHRSGGSVFPARKVPHQTSATRPSAVC